MTGRNSVIAKWSYPLLFKALALGYASAAAYACFVELDSGWAGWVERFGIALAPFALMEAFLGRIVVTDRGLERRKWTGMVETANYEDIARLEMGYRSTFNVYKKDGTQVSVPRYLARPKKLMDVLRLELLARGIEVEDD